MWERESEGIMGSHRKPNCVKSHFPHSVFIGGTLNLLPVHKIIDRKDKLWAGGATMEKSFYSFFSSLVLALNVRCWSGRWNGTRAEQKSN